MPINMGGIFAQRAFFLPDLLAWVGRNYRATFHEANQRINRCVGFLKACRVARGDDVICRPKA